MPIRVLSEETINKIAAGEVVEDPSSVVKELVENAIDAKATSIVVEIKGTGGQMVRKIQTCLGGRLGECAIAIVPIELISKIHAHGDIEVQPAITVIIKPNRRLWNFADVA